MVIDYWRILLPLSVIWALLNIWLLASRADVLLLEVGPGLPFGTISAWSGLIALSGSLYIALLKYPGNAFNKPYFLRLVLQMSFVLALAWGLFSYVLAGNWAYDFSNVGMDKFKTWVYLTGFTTLFPIFGTVMYGGWLLSWRYR